MLRAAPWVAEIDVKEPLPRPKCRRLHRVSRRSVAYKGSAAQLSGARIERVPDSLNDLHQCIVLEFGIHWQTQYLPSRGL